METLLVLEDEPAVQGLLRYILKGFSLIEATSAEQALRLFADHNRRIDLLVADVTLPTSSGIQVALRLRLEIPNLPVVLTSGYPVSAWSPQQSADLETLGSKSLAILQKPFNAQTLLNTVRTLIRAPQSAAGTA